MAYEIKIASDARKYLEKLDKPTRKRFSEQLADLRVDPWNNSKHLVNTKPEARSCRVGDWRIVLAIHEADQVVVISTIQPRGQVYKRL